MSPYLFGAGIIIVGLRLDAGAALSSSWPRYLHSYCIPCNVSRIEPR